MILSLVKPGEYHDSVSLMLVARDLASQPGVKDAAVVMATEANKSILSSAGLLTLEIQKAGPSDLVLAVAASDSAHAEQAIHKAQELLNRKAFFVKGEHRPRNIRNAVSYQSDLNLAVISVAGRFAADEAWEALKYGLHVLLFSDNVSLEDEISLKKYARDHGLLLMGPGAGTAILNKVALGFANVVPSGPVGIVSAAGTGLQEVSCLLARSGVGISQAIGTGGRDLKKEVGGIMMLHGLQALQEDPATDVIVLISKPPDPEIATTVLEQTSASQKPVIVCFLGAAPDTQPDTSKLIFTRTLQECSILAVDVVGSEKPDLKSFYQNELDQLYQKAYQIKRSLDPQRIFLRGIFSGGTLCYEAQVIWQDMHVSPVYSNAPLPGGSRLPDSTRSVTHTAVDLGEEEFTVGRPHPMIDNDLRIRRLLQEARDPQTAVIHLDVVLGYGAHPDPAGELGPAIRQARSHVRENGFEIPVVVSVTGTENDPQCLSRTVSALKDAGATVCDSNAAAARLAGLIVSARTEGD